MAHQKLRTVTAFVASAAAGEALAPVRDRRVVGVRLVVWMALRAVSRIRMLARSANAAHQVLAPVDWLEMIRVHARMDSAQVVEIHADRDRANEQLVGHSVRGSEAPTPARARHGFDKDVPIALVVRRACPEPASARLLHLRPQAFGNRPAQIPAVQVAVSVQPRVVHRAHQVRAVTGLVASVNRAWFGHGYKVAESCGDA